MITVVPKIISKHPSTGMKFFPGKGHLFCPEGKLTLELQLNYGSAPKDPVNVELLLRSIDSRYFQFRDDQTEMTYLFPDVHPDKRESLIVCLDFALFTQVDQKQIEEKPIRISVETRDQRTPQHGITKVASWLPLFMPVV